MAAEFFQDGESATVAAGPVEEALQLRAAHAGLRVALIEENEPGGVCLHTGCIPTKTMAAGVGLLRKAHANRHLNGLHFRDVGPMARLILRAPRLCNSYQLQVLLHNDSQAQFYPGT